MRRIVGVVFAIVIQKVVNTVTTSKWEGGVIDMKKTLKKRVFNQASKVFLCAGIAPMATYEADCWSGVCYSSGCYAMGC